MKSFQEYQLSEAKAKYELRADGRETSPVKGMDADAKKRIIGWFANKYNPASGWVITSLDKFDQQWLSDKGVLLVGVYRVYSDRGNTSIVKIDAKKGTYAFVDNGHLEKTDEVKFEKAVAYSRLVIDNNRNAIGYFPGVQTK